MMIHRICICGAGTMGSGIAQAAAQAGFHSTLFDLNETVLSRAQQQIQQNLEGQVKKGKMTDHFREEVGQRLHFSTDLQECLADVIIEAIVEKPEAKIALFNQLAEINHGEVIFATNTSSLSVHELAKSIQGPERVIGMHFFNPATIMKLVEVVNSPLTNELTTQTIITLAKAMGKTPVICRDAPGFIVNRVARPFYIESLRILEEKIAGLSQIDQVLESTGFKLGPFRLMDLIGNDVNYAVSCSVYEQLGSPERLKPSPIQAQKVKEGRLGKKTGAGYYEYPAS